MGIVATYMRGKCSPGKNHLKNRHAVTEKSSRLYYYGYRCYDPVTGCWPSRITIGERGQEVKGAGSSLEDIHYFLLTNFM